MENENQQNAEMIEGYLALAQEHREFAAMAVESALEVIPKWE